MNIHDYIEKIASSRRQLRMVGRAKDRSKRLSYAERNFRVKAPDSVYPKHRKAYEDQMNQRSKDIQLTDTAGKYVWKKHNYGQMAAQAFARGDDSLGRHYREVGRRARVVRDRKLNAIKDPQLRREGNFMFKRGPLPERLRRKK